MGRKQRRRGTSGGGTTTSRRRREIVPWRERARDVIGRLRSFARDGWSESLELFLATRFGDEADQASVADLQVAFDDYVAAPGGAGDEKAPTRSIARIFAQEDASLEPSERQALTSWETERERHVYLLDRAHRDRLDLWDPLAGGRVVLHLVEKLPAAAAAALGRGTVVIASSAPWAGRRIVLGQLELYDSDDAIEMFRAEVRQDGRTWHDLPPPVPAPGLS